MSRTTKSKSQPYAEEAHAIKARNVSFEWGEVPLHYIPDEPLATQFWNVMHLVIPIGERLMAGALSEALPSISDERLREEAIGFIGQETMHADSHEGYHEHLAAHGIEVEPVVRNASLMLQKILSDHGLKGRAKKEWLAERLAFYAAAEHFTAVVGQWLLDAEGLDEAQMHPMMLDLLRWHGAEEVEHRDVLFDVFQHVDGSYARRARWGLLASAGLLGTWLVSLNYLMAQDPSRRWWKPWPLQIAGAVRRGLVPSFTIFATEIPVYLKPGFHPSSMGTLDSAIQYLAASPAARAAEQGS